MGTNVKNVNDIIIGSGRLYVDGSDVGQLKDEVGLTHGKEYFELEAGFPAQTILKTLSKETMTLSVSLLEANLPILRTLIDEYSEYTETAGTATVTDEVVTVTAGVWTALDHGTLTAISAKDSEDTALAEGTDYILDVIGGKVTRVSDSVAIADGDSIKVSYTYATATASGFGMGGAATESTTHLVEFVHKRRDGKYRVIKLWTAKLGGDFTMSFQEAAESPVPVEIAALADSTKAAGQQFGLVFDTTTAPYTQF